MSKPMPPRLLLAASAILLLLATTNSAAPTEGEPCGPTYANGQLRGVWMRVPASSLVATSASGTSTTADGSGCVTSASKGYAANVHAYMPGLVADWTVYSVAAKLKLAKPSSVPVSVLLGDVDLPAVVQKLQTAGDLNKLSSAVRSLSLCGTKRVSAKAEEYLIQCDTSKCDTASTFLGFFAQGGVPQSLQHPRSLGGAGCQAGIIG